MNNEVKIAGDTLEENPMKAPPLTKEDLEEKTEMYEDLMNKDCIKYNKRVICYCIDLEECEFIKECDIANSLLYKINK